MTTSIAKYAEDPKTIHLYPFDLYDEDLTPDCGVEIDDICTEIHEACKGWGKDSKRLVKALGNTIGKDRRRIAIRFPEMYDKDLTLLMKDECGNNNEMGAATQFLSSCQGVNWSPCMQGLAGEIVSICRGC